VTIVHQAGFRLFCWLPPEKLEDALRIYERVAAKRDVSNTDIRRTNLYLANLIRTELKKWKHLTPTKKVDIDCDSVLTIDVPWTMKIVHQLEQSYSRTDMIIALDTFWAHYHESFSEAARMYENPKTRTILMKLDGLAR